MGQVDEKQRPRFLDLPLQGRLLSTRRRRLAALLVACILIPAWQAYFAKRQGLPDAYRLRSSAGVHDEAKLIYFYYYLGLFPVATEKEDLVYSKDGAREVLEKHGDTLVMELGHTLRYGELGVTFLYLPGVILAGTPRYLSFVPCHAIVFVGALLALFVAFWWAGRPVLGAFVVAFLGSNPFQLYEVYVSENVFGWQISAAILVLAAHIPLLGFRQPSRWVVWAVPVASGVLLATVRQVRPEPIAMLLPALACYLTAPGLRWRVRGGLVAALLVVFLGTSKGCEAYFDCKWEQARRRVTAAGGHPYTGPRELYHMVWHNIWCGLGDYDKKHGYVWNDVVAARYARPILERKYGLTLPEWDGKSLIYENAFWDEAGKYYKTPYEMPHYGEVLRAKVLHDITHDPLWYLGILARRVWRVLCDTTPFRLGVGRRRIDLPLHGLVIFPVIAVLLWQRCWPLVKVVGFSLPLCLTALLIYSANGMALYSCYHLFAAAILFALVVEGVLWYRRWRRARASRG